MNGLEEKLERLISILSAQKVPENKQLWTAQQCAAYLSCSMGHFSKRIAAKPSFPKAIDINGGTNKTLRWRAKDVMDWTEAQRIA